jgi:hypothetical protein
MINNSLYVPIKSVNLTHYFNRAIILPAKYYSNRNDDIQDNAINSIVISNHKWVKNCDCSIKIVLTPKEQNNLISNSKFLFESQSPIPISRITQIYFLEEEIKSNILWDINNGTAFIPKQICKVNQDEDVEFCDDNWEETSLNDFSGIVESKINLNIEKFNILLGGMAFMKIGRESFMNYSYNYFSTLSLLNKYIESGFHSASKKAKLEFSNKYNGLFNDENESDWEKWKKYIYKKDLNKSDIEKIANKENVELDYKVGMIVLDSIDSNTTLFDLAVLAEYKQFKNTDNLVTDLSNGKIPPEKAENISLLFGLNIGYGALRNKYITGNNEYIIKFLLDSKLDYYIIESIYQFIFCKKRNSAPFEYLDNWVISKIDDKVDKKYITYPILDTFVIAKKKPTPLEEFLEYFSKDFYPKLTSILEKYIPPYLELIKDKTNSYFEQRLDISLKEAIRSFQEKLRNEYQLESQENITLLTSDYNRKIKNLEQEICNLNVKLDDKKEEINSINLQLKETEILSAKTFNKKDSFNKETSELPLSSPTEDGLNEKTMKELLNIAKEMNMQRYSSLSKKMLIQLIRSEIKTKIQFPF